MLALLAAAARGEEKLQTCKRAPRSPPGARVVCAHAMTRRCVLLVTVGGSVGSNASPPLPQIISECTLVKRLTQLRISGLA